MFRRSIFDPVGVEAEKDLRSLRSGAGNARFSKPLENELTPLKEFRIPSAPEEHLVSVNDPASHGAELVRTLSARLRQTQKRHSIKKLLVTSAIPGEGKTLVSANLAITLALHHNRVLLIDGDLRSASLSRWFDIADDSFASSWEGEGPHRLPSFRKAEGLPLWVVPSGKPVEMPGNILQSAEFSEALAAIEPDFDWIVLDSPPLLPFGDAGILAGISDAVILVTRKGVTPKDALRDALKAFDKTKIIATILNCADVTTQKYYRKYYEHMGGALLPPGGTIIAQPRVLTPK